MKNKMMVIGIIVVAFILASQPVFGNSNDDYRVIKNAVKGNKTKGNISWFKISVVDKRTKKSKVKIKLPFSLVEMLAECSDDDFEIKNDCNISLKKIIKIFKRHGPMTLVEVDEDDELIKIWFE